MFAKRFSVVVPRKRGVLQKRPASRKSADYKKTAYVRQTPLSRVFRKHSKNALQLVALTANKSRHC